MAQRTDRRERDTRTAILDIAERLVQNRGFNGFSYADVAEQLSITTPALHYHFAGKAELGEALISRYATTFAIALEQIDATVTDAPAKLEAYADLYLEVLRDQRMCLCGILAAEYETLPKLMTENVIRFFDDNEQWLAHVLEQGQQNETLQFTGTTLEAARMIVGTLEGAMLLARPYGDVARFQTSAARLIADLSAS